MRPLLLLTWLAGAVPASATCGLDRCPMDAHHAVEAGPVWRAEASVRRAEFDLGGVSGDYTQVSPRLERRESGWLLGAVAPVARLAAGGTSRTGAANPVLFGERAVGRRSVLGLQFELPLGDHDHGFAAEHMEFLPYGSTALEAGLAHVMATAGARVSLGSHGHGGAAAPVLINPHEDYELLLRVGASREVGIVRPELFLDGQFPLDHGSAFVSAGAAAAESEPGRFSPRLALEFPLTSQKRFDWRATASLSLAF